MLEEEANLASHNTSKSKNQHHEQDSGGHETYASLPSRLLGMAISSM